MYTHFSGFYCFLLGSALSIQQTTRRWWCSIWCPMSVPQVLTNSWPVLRSPNTTSQSADRIRFNKWQIQWCDESFSEWEKRTMQPVSTIMEHDGLKQWSRRQLAHSLGLLPLDISRLHFHPWIALCPTLRANSLATAAASNYTVNDQAEPFFGWLAMTDKYDTRQAFA